MSQVGTPIELQFEPIRGFFVPPVQFAEVAVDAETGVVRVGELSPKPQTSTTG